MRRTAETIWGFLHLLLIAASLAGPALILGDTFVEDGALSLAAWRNIFGDWSRWAVLLTNTGIACGVAVAFCLVVGVTLALGLFKTGLCFRTVTTALLFFCAAIPLYVINGAVLSVIGIERALGSAIVVGLIHGLAHLPITVLIIGIALKTVDADLEESALVEGAGTFSVLVRVSLRLAVGGVVAAALLVVLWVTTDYCVSDVLVVRTFAEEVYTQYALHGRPDEPALVCLPQIVLFGGLLWVLRRRFLTGGGPLLAGDAGKMFQITRWRVPLSLGVLGLGVALVVVPVASLIPRLIGMNDFWARVRLFWPELSTSALTSFAAAVLAGTFGLGLAWRLVRFESWRRLIVLYVVFMLALPAPVLGIGMIRLFNHPGPLANLYDSQVILVAAYVFRFLPVATILLIPAVRAVPVECELAARSDGCGHFAVWRKIVWPMCLPATLAVMFLVMVLSLGELPCSLLVTPPGYVTVGARFFSLIHYGMYPDAATLCLLSIASVVVPSAGLWWLLRRRILQ